MNTRINYMYRDASNYKSFNTAVVDGILSDTDCHAIYHCCDDDGGQRYFIPHMVGLPEKTFEDYGQYDDDHPWFEIDQFFAEGTNDAPTVDLTAKQLVENFRKMSGQWDAEIAREAKEAAEKEYVVQKGQEPYANEVKKTAEPAVPLSAPALTPAAMSRTIWMQTSCFAPTVKVTIDIPKDRDAEEYIDEFLDAILSEEARANCEWDFV